MEWYEILGIVLGSIALGAFGLYAYICYRLSKDFGGFDDEWHKSQDEMMKDLLKKE